MGISALLKYGGKTVKGFLEYKPQTIAKNVFEYKPVKTLAEKGDKFISSPKVISAKIEESLPALSQKISQTSTQIRTLTQNEIKNEFRNLEVLKKFDESDRYFFMHEVLGSPGNGYMISDCSSFYLVAKNAKPATILSSYANDTSYLKKMSGNIDVFERINPKSKMKNIFVLNKPLVKRVIAQNTELFTTRTGLSKTATVDEIYAKLISKDSPLKKEAESSDIIGLIMGYPKYNTMIYRLERWLDSNNYIDKHIGIFRHGSPEYLQKMFKKALFDPNSPYKDMSEKFKLDLLQKINEIKTIKPNGELFGKDFQIIYPFTYYVNEPAEIAKIQKNLENIAIK